MTRTLGPARPLSGQGRFSPPERSSVKFAETLFAGEILGSGTVGTGSAHESGRKLAPNDVVELEIEKIGVLRNRIVKPER